MVKQDNDIALPRYRGQAWIQADLPRTSQFWQLGGQRSVGKEVESADDSPLGEALDRQLRRHDWSWPSRTQYFISDMHADTDAFFASLVACGGVRKTGPADRDFKLTKAGKKARFLIGGDCFDKGPSTLRLLRALRLLWDKGARVVILAGNHDIRMMLGIRSLSVGRSPGTEHFFVRMGPKAVPFLKEVYDQYLQGKHALRDVPGNHECRRRLFPSDNWFEEFPALAATVMSEAGVQRETKRLRKKMDRFENDCAEAGLSMRMVYAAARKWEQLFLQPKGEFYWFFRHMRLAHRDGSFLFIHAGVDDRIARLIRHKGVKYINRQFRKQLQGDIFNFYFGAVANTFRTKYRDVDMPLTRKGVRKIHRSGIHAIVHGHRNLRHGQRIMLRKGMIHFECDSSVDRGTRKKEGLGERHGAAVTIFRPDGMVLGISTDYPRVKVFRPDPRGWSTS